MIALLLLAAQAAAQTQEPAPVRSAEAVERTLTIYRDDLAFVTEVHEVDLPAGRSTVVFGSVNDRMVPQTALLLGFEGATLERNFDQNLLSKGSLFRALVGSDALLRRTDAATGRSERVRATVLSAEGGVVLETPDGVETLDCTALPQTLVAPNRPNGLTAAPELSVVMNAAEPGPATLRLAYLTDGIGWSADYVLNVTEDNEAHLRGWLTFTNDTNDAFGAVPAAIIAGTLQVTDDTEAPAVSAIGYRAACWPQATTTDIPLRRAQNPYLLGFDTGRGGLAFRDAMMAESRAAPMAAPEAEMMDGIVVTGARLATEERFGDYKLYRPPGPVTLAPYQTKQIAFLDEAAIEVAHRYDIEISVSSPPTIRPAQTVYVIDNDAGGRLARALPAGTVRAMTRVDGDAFYLGEDDIRDLAVGRPVEIATGRANDVNAQLVWGEATRSRLARRTTQRVTATLRNALNRPAPVRLTLPGWSDRNGFEVQGPRRARVDGEPYPTWDVTVPSGTSRTVTLTLSWRN